MVSTVEEVDLKTIEGLTALILELLSELLEEDANDLRRRLLDEGGEMPVDSLDMLDILQEFRVRTGLRLPVRELRAEQMRSVLRFAEFVAAAAAHG